MMRNPDQAPEPTTLLVTIRAEEPRDQYHRLLTLDTLRPFGFWPKQSDEISLL
jgi:hypothetical protein